MKHQALPARKKIVWISLIISASLLLAGYMLSVHKEMQEITSCTA
jgi:hypothetical protein